MALRRTLIATARPYLATRSVASLHHGLRSFKKQSARESLVAFQGAMSLAAGHVRDFSSAAVGSPQAAKEALGYKILQLKKDKGLKWKDLAFKIGQSPVWTCALCLGQMSATPDQARKLGNFLGLSEGEIKSLTDIPYRGGAHPYPPTDPLVYRLQELIYVYSGTFKEVIQEEFGDGIMSAIDFEMDISRVPDPKGDRVKIVMNGKFLPYKRY